MLNLYISYENFINNFEDLYLDVISIVAILSSILVVISKNPIISILFLIILFSSIAVYLIMLGITFIGLSYLLVYIGAISILFLFILMLINIRISELAIDTNNSIPLGFIITTSIYLLISKVLPESGLNNIINNSFNYYNNIIKIFDNLTLKFYDFNINIDLNTVFYNISNNKIKYVSHNSWDGNLAEYSHIASIGNIMYTSYSIWLILTSIILLLAMVGAIVITVKPKKN